MRQVGPQRGSEHRGEEIWELTTIPPPGQRNDGTSNGELDVFLTVHHEMTIY